jgi:hypothetical protein
MSLDRHPVADLQFRLAGSEDAGAIAALHADSWRRHYRGAYSDAFLNGDVHGDRLAIWTERLRDPDPRTRTIVAEAGDGVVGFAHTIFEDDARWGRCWTTSTLHPGRSVAGSARGCWR